MTDAHVVLGHITAASLSGGVTLDPAAAHLALGVLAATLVSSVERVARAMIDIADAAVARALRRVSVERGVDPRGCVLVPFGGGGPLHCCGLAGQLGISRIFVPPHSGALSALGLAITAERRERLLSVLRLASELDAPAVETLLAAAASGIVAEDGWERRWMARARFVGQGHELDVPVHRGDDGAALARRFSALHHERNGFTLDAPVEVVALRYIASGTEHPVRFTRHDGSQWRDDHRVDDGGTFAADLGGGDVVVLPGATLRIGEGWRGVPHPSGGWLLERHAS